MRYSVEQDKITELGEIDIPETIGTGWGAASDGKYLYISNGTPSIFKTSVSAEEMVVISEVKAHYQNGTQVGNLNELEYVNGTIFANVFPTMDVVNIDLSDGTVV